jgi:hypothetical protein
MSVNSFDDEDAIRAAYEAAERVLWHAIDVGEITSPIPQWEETVARLAVRIAEAVMHSSEADIADMVPGIVKRVE